MRRYPSTRFLPAGAALCGLTSSISCGPTHVAALDPGYRKKSIVNVWLAGAASSPLDTSDMKPDAPSEIRGEFTSIATKLPSAAICEHLPRIAARMDRIALIRSLTGVVDSHDGAMKRHGLAPLGSMRAVGGRPNVRLGTLPSCTAPPTATSQRASR
jgi:hypothetical protein